MECILSGPQADSPAPPIVPDLLCFGGRKSA